ncbi:MAG TPA: hypothetical protein VG963_07965 [Polyangiaceae bacterium]|nr:hypothetical protein [Polyangiaceae bacterium]
MVAAPSDNSEALDDIEDVRSKLQELAAEGRVDELIDWSSTCSCVFARTTTIWRCS